MPIPVASDTTEELADWLELQAVCSVEKLASLESLVRLLRRAGTTDALVGLGGDRGSTESQRVGEDAFSEIGSRVSACGANGDYPFEVEQGLIRLKPKMETGVYVFLLLLSQTQPTAGHNGTAALFEHICRHAAHQYLGGANNSAVAVRFGSPRRQPLARFNKAIDDLCLQIGEGGGCRQTKIMDHTGDDGLDIVAWRNFPDLREGKLIAFGQCAGGKGTWEDKLAEMDGRKFASKWFRDQLTIDPVRLFFLPRRVPQEAWHNAGIDGGILFDRCRIVACSSGMGAELAGQCRKVATRLALAMTAS